MPDVTISAEEFYNLKQQLAATEQRLADLAQHVARLEAHDEDLHARHMNKMADLANGMKGILEVVDKRFDKIESVLLKELE